MKVRDVGVLGVVLALALAASCRSTTEPEGEVPTLPVVPGETVLFLDDFDNENNGVGVTNWTNFRNWDVLDGCVDLHGNGFYDVQPGKGLYVDLDGSCRAAGTIETKAAFDLQPGRYVLEYWLAGNQRTRRSDTVDVTLGTVFTRRFILAMDDPFTLYTETLTVTAPVSVKLRFRNHGGDHQGALLDLVRLRRVE